MLSEQSSSQETIGSLKVRLKIVVDPIRKSIYKFIESFTRTIAIIYRKEIPAARVYLSTKNRRIKRKNQKKIFAQLVREAVGQHGKTKHPSRHKTKHPGHAKDIPFNE